jgi:hypothetical protein
LGLELLPLSQRGNEKMTDFSDSCLKCGGHLRGNVYSKNVCPECEQLTETKGDPLAGKLRFPIKHRMPERGGWPFERQPMVRKDDKWL